MNLETVRKSKGLSQTALDEIAQLPRGTTNDIERGKNRNPSLRVVRQLADALDSTPDELFPVKTENGNAA